MPRHFDDSLQTLSSATRTSLAPAPAPVPVPVPDRVPTSPSFPFQRMDAYRHARELARRVHASSIADAELRDQATRAAKSAFLNLCEGLPDDRPAVRRRYFRQADGSVHEVAGALDLAAAIGALDERVARETIALAARVRALLRGLMR